MKITICVGSTCHLLGSKRVVDRMKELVEEHHLGDRVFCMGKCGEGVCVTVDGETTSIQPDDVDTFFSNEVLAKL